MSKTSKRKFWGRLRSLGYTTYGEYLASEHWADVKRRFWASNKNRRCKGCNKPATQIHHRTYKRLGAERLGMDLYAVCRECHVRIHEAEKYLPESWGLFSISKAATKHPGMVRDAKHRHETKKANEKELETLIADQKRDMARRL